jgi:superfamily II DNA/RNA helicase
VEGLEIARLGISARIVEKLAARGITRLFPIQVLPLTCELADDDAA